MKSSFKSTLLCFFLLGITSISYSQNVDEIINSYYETIGGKNWDAVNGMRMTANLDQEGMIIPIEVVQMKDGRSYTKVTFNGNTMIVDAFDGKTSWGINWMTMLPEESPAEDSENERRTAGEFPDALLNYKDLGYTATLLGSEKIEGTDCNKIKLEKKTELIEGKELPSTEYYYLDKESNVPVMMESEINSGEMKGKISQTKFSDYQEVNGVYFPFSTTQGLKDGESQTIQFEKIEVNPTVDDSIFTFPKK
jgi:outer membrane lipoprotein-sorting protein